MDFKEGHLHGASSGMSRGALRSAGDALRDGDLGRATALTSHAWATTHPKHRAERFFGSVRVVYVNGRQLAARE